MTIDDLLRYRDHLKTVPEFEIYLVQYRFPRSRKHRIRRKWSRNLRNYRTLIP